MGRIAAKKLKKKFHCITNKYTQFKDEKIIPDFRATLYVLLFYEFSAP